MASVYKRSDSPYYWARLKGLKQPGKWSSSRTPHIDEAEAEKWAKDAQDEIDKRRAAPVQIPTVRQFSVNWLQTRRDLDLSWRTDRTHLDNHILPAIGDMLLPDVTEQHVLDIAQSMRKKKLAPRYVWNVYSTLTAFFREAQIARHVRQTPCILTSKHLGERVDKEDDWRKDAVFGREEAELAISSLVIPWDRAVHYALDFLAGVRHGEAAGLRWARYDRTTTPLRQLRVSKSYDSRANAEKKTKTKSERLVPVVPQLAAILDDWFAYGWRHVYGRDPQPTDLVIPLPPAGEAARRTRKGEPFRSYDYSGKKWREIDLPNLNLRHRRGHDTRSTFITLLLEDGANRDVIRDYVTHTKSKRSAFDGYDRGIYWKLACAEVAKLQFATPVLRSVALGLVVDGKPVGEMVEAAGIEPALGERAARGNSSNARKDGAVMSTTEADVTTTVARLATDLAAEVLRGRSIKAQKRLAAEIERLVGSRKAAPSRG